MTDDLHLTIQQEGRPDFKLPVKRNGGTLRCSFGALGRRAGMWTIRVNPKGDVYVTERCLVKAFKLSLHESGDSRWQWVWGSIGRSPVAKSAVQQNGGKRLMSQWSRPAANAVGMVHAFTILTTGADVVAVPGDRARADTVWLPPPLRDEIASVELVLLDADKGFQRIEGAAPLAVFGTTGRVPGVLVLAAKRKPAEGERASIAGLRAQIRSSGAHQAAEKARDDRSVIRALLLGAPGPDGVASAVDFAMFPDP